MKDNIIIRERVLQGASQRLAGLELRLPMCSEVTFTHL